MAYTIAAANRKGGVGKTSIIANVGYTAAADGQWRTLIVDLDPQANCGDDLGYAYTDATDNGQNLLYALLGTAPLVPAIKGIRPNLDVVPSGALINEAEAMISSRAQRGVDANTALRDALEPLQDEYDLILIDTPPSSITLIQQALVAADAVIIPTKSDRGSIGGVVQIAQDMIEARKSNPDLTTMGAVLFGIGASASAVRRNATEDITAVLGDEVPVLGSIRHVEAAATHARESGKLPSEIDRDNAELEPAWKALREGRTPEQGYPTAKGLSGDYLNLTNAVLHRVNVGAA